MTDFIKAFATLGRDSNVNYIVERIDGCKFTDKLLFFVKWDTVRYKLKRFKKFYSPTIISFSFLYQ